MGTTRGTDATEKETREKEQKMYRDFYAAQDRTLRQQEFSDKVAERQRYARSEDKTLAARQARPTTLLPGDSRREGGDVARGLGAARSPSALVADGQSPPEPPAVSQQLFAEG